MAFFTFFRPSIPGQLSHLVSFPQKCFKLPSATISRTKSLYSLSIACWIFLLLYTADFSFIFVCVLCFMFTRFTSLCISAKPDSCVFAFNKGRQ